MTSTCSDMILSLVRFFLWVLNTFIASPPPKHKNQQGGSANVRTNGTSSRYRRDSRGPHRRNPANGSKSTTNTTDKSKSHLQEALQYFEISQESMTRSVIKKKYKTLSLIHHPDRNGNSSESNREMQRINHFFDVLDREMLRREGNGDKDSDQKKQGESNHKSSKKGQPPVPPKMEKQRARQSQPSHQSFPQQARRRQEMEREMKREWQESVRQMKVFKVQRKTLRRNNRRLSLNEDLDSAWGRDQAHAIYLSAVDAWQQQAGRKRQMQPVGKPRNALMEYCNEEAVVAMRLGKTNVAIEIVHEELASAGEEWFYYKMRSSPSSYGQGRSIKLDQSYCRLALKVLTRPLDEDQNSILHYAVYMEEHDMISFLILTARRYRIFPQLVLYQNGRRLTAGDYALGCFRDSGIPRMMQHLTREAKHSMEENTLNKRLRRAVNQSLPRHPRDLKPLLKTVPSILFGKYIMRHGWVLSVFIAAISLTYQSRNSDSKKQGYVGSTVSSLVALHLQWILIFKAWFQLCKLSDALIDASIPRIFQFFLLAAIVLFLVPAKHLSRFSSIAVAPMPILDQLVLEVLGYASMLTRRMKKTMHSQ